jgi:hypothetical protein
VREAMSVEEASEDLTRAEEIKSRVSAYIEVNGCMIGIVTPKCDSGRDDVAELYRTLVEIHVRQAKRKAAQE